MKIVDIVTSDIPSLSFEIFPPKTTTAIENVTAAAEKIASLSPSFMSVTYGAGGNTAEFTADIAGTIENRFHVPALAHLTCLTSNKSTILKQLGEFKKNGIQNVLALRGDYPKEGGLSTDYKYANELAADIQAYGGFCIGGACYPEGHPESRNQKEDILNLKKKTESGCEFLTTQMFFDNNILYNFMYKIREADIKVPVIAGIMPVTNGKQIKRICSLSETRLPPRFIQIVDRYSDNPPAMAQAGIAYATEQIIDLFANGINAVHVYSMNKPDVAGRIMENLSEII